MRESLAVQQEATDRLRRSESFKLLAPAQQQKVLSDTWKVFGYIGDSGAAGLMGITPKNQKTVTARPFAGNGKPTDQDYIDGAGQALANTVNAVDFPGFVGDLVKGVFQAVVDASIQQMEAYSELVANVSKSVDQYMKDNVSEEQGRDYLVNQYPDHFEADHESGRIAAKQDAEADSAPNFMQDLGLPFDFSDVDDEEAEKEIVTSARRKLAMDRQQLLTTMVMMGLNRIVVTDGSIKAGVSFDLNTVTLQKRHFDRQRSFENNRTSEGNSKKSGFWFLKPKTESSYENTLNVTTDSNLTTDNERSMDMKVKMTGNVDLRFKSDYFPMEKMVEIFGMDQEVITTRSKQGAPSNAPTAPASPGIPAPPLPGS